MRRFINDIFTKKREIPPPNKPPVKSGEVAKINDAETALAKAKKLTETNLNQGVPSTAKDIENLSNHSKVIDELKGNSNARKASDLTKDISGKSLDVEVEKAIADTRPIPSNVVNTAVDGILTGKTSTIDTVAVTTIGEIATGATLSTSEGMTLTKQTSASLHENITRQIADGAAAQNLSAFQKVYTDVKKVAAKIVEKAGTREGKALTALIGLITLSTIISVSMTGVITADNVSTTPINSDNPTSTPIAKNKYEDVYLYLSVYCYNKDMNGCFMIKGQDVYKIEGCGDWYSENFDNQLECSCSDKLESSLVESKCDNSEECAKPYCLGKCDNKDINSCSVPGIQYLPKCTNFKMGDAQFIYYKYVSKPPTSIISDFVEFLPEKPSSIIPIIVGVIIISALLLIIYLINKQKK